MSASAATNAARPPFDRSDHGSFYIRLYEPNDHDAVIKIFSDGIKEHARNERQLEAFDNYTKLGAEKDLKQPDVSYAGAGSGFWVAIDKETEAKVARGEDTQGVFPVMGCVGLQPRLLGDTTNQGKEIAVQGAEYATHGELRRLSVNPQFRNRGVGSALIQHLHHFAAQCDRSPQPKYTRLHLTSLRWMEAAARLYVKYGWERTKVESAGEEHPEIMVQHMERSLP